MINKILKSNIIINPIPSNYKKLNGIANIDENISSTFIRTNIDTTKSYEGSIKIHNPDSKLQFFLITKANGVNVSIKSITINESVEDNTATLNLTSSDLAECTTIQFRVLSINGPFYTDDWKLILH